jgi:dimeric dUTPase (all-alpha-NTP-PPase superfamily)
MNLAKLFVMQRDLDLYIENSHNLENENLIDKKILALLVELSELANETRCFKFWSLKPSAAKEKVLEEFVDGIHFILSLGLECGFEKEEIDIKARSGSNELTHQFLTVFEAISEFKHNLSFTTYVQLFEAYLTLGVLLGFSEKETELAYFQKNEVNYARQAKGY